ncbi:hypothetical protein ASPCAL05019 [Aspergillus calidoustus]|uniref:Uncharacterized protein n=1 Tax=Aspergillus calidoustus TaxID=454130 RepID=A0A0U5C6I0_ASPCI|nr:hypothetical protein ASPCAL05019 [Aspergillus calidoustus]
MQVRKLDEASVLSPTIGRGTLQYRTILHKPPETDGDIETSSTATGTAERPTRSPLKRQTGTNANYRLRTHAVETSQPSPSARKATNTSVQKRKSVTGTTFEGSPIGRRARGPGKSSSNAAKGSHRTVLWSSSPGPPLSPASTNTRHPSRTSIHPDEPKSHFVPLDAPFQSSARAGFPAEGQNYRELYTPAPDPNKENIGETLERIRSSEVDKHAQLQDEIQALQHQQSAITDRIARLEGQAAQARRNSGRAERFLERPEKLLRLDRSSLYKWVRAMDIPEPRNSSLRQSNGGNECADENRVIVLSD